MRSPLTPLIKGGTKKVLLGIKGGTKKVLLGKGDGRGIEKTGVRSSVSKVCYLAHNAPYR
ncbi:MAG TPA: hypothetical protein DEG17_19065 [Cyanobacteria bacterium UBA11149]|nr:hypothetical protein [Cyanobacteria bacterium UBA11367]HBE59316.1 hypothetical protein [Cyanobacteria bacterium UBA11366]HBR73730.1 hypothetical protein [Cyanobacteria bacterium UBA11159]HBS68159.1 hypothetical protein [Cyanobacteria bacterium UBA11153]HBW90910.1 hypothetical protein [Cyanobacteria bacterium UBA11149]HCA95308.1 hypothetical protein [Cyanobacteria bacterium UBA9226]